jgi:hypothetical protein
MTAPVVRAVVGPWPGSCTFPSVMDQEPTARVLWHKRPIMVERRETTSERHLSTSLRVDEVTLIAAAGATQAIAMESWAEL